MNQTTKTVRSNYTFVVKLDVGNFGDDILEKSLLPTWCRMCHHCLYGVVVLLVLVVQEHQLRPQVGLLCCS